MGMDADQRTTATTRGEQGSNLELVKAWLWKARQIVGLLIPIVVAYTVVVVPKVDAPQLLFARLLGEFCTKL
jgi:hypothetical protein